jgi:hypothetical protein
LSLKTKVNGLWVVWTQNHSDDFSSVWPQNNSDGFHRFGLKTVATVSGGLASKLAMTVSDGLASKPAMTVSVGLASKPAATVSIGSVLKPAATVCWFVPQNYVSFSLSVAPQNWWKEIDAEHVSGSSSKSARVSHSGLKTRGGATMSGACDTIVEVTSKASWR